jgi:hypothetical protein
MKRLFQSSVLLGLVGLLLFPVNVPGVSAQDVEEPTSFRDVRLWIYPEYDDPRLLVMLEGKIVGTEAPAEVNFLVPSAAEMYSAGSKDAQGVYTGGPPQREPSSIPGWDKITYQVIYETFRVEYYDPIILGRPDKTISYESHWLYPIDYLEVTVQEPRSSSDFIVSPTGSVFVDNEGFTSYFYDYSNLDDSSQVEFEIAYTKSDARPSLSISDEDSNGPMVGIIIAIVVGIVAVGLFLWMRKPKVRTRAARRQQSRAIKKGGTPARQSKTRYCTECGQSIDGSFKYCPNCGKGL